MKEFFESVRQCKTQGFTLPLVKGFILESKKFMWDVGKLPSTWTGAREDIP